MANPFVHIELQTQNIEAAKKFYGSLLDWKFNDMPSPTGPYTMIETGQKDVGGGMFSMPGAPPLWLAYIQVGDVAASTKKAQTLGAKVIKDKTDIPGMGAFSIIQDPAGAMVGLWQSTR